LGEPVLSGVEGGRGGSHFILNNYKNYEGVILANLTGRSGKNTF